MNIYGSLPTFMVDSDLFLQSSQTYLKTSGSILDRQSESNKKNPIIHNKKSKIDRNIISLNNMNKDTENNYTLDNRTENTNFKYDSKDIEAFLRASSAVATKRLNSKIPIKKTSIFKPKPQVHKSLDFQQPETPPKPLVKLQEKIRNELL
jgi:hypothetical protein